MRPAVHARDAGKPNHKKLETYETLGPNLKIDFSDRHPRWRPTQGQVAILQQVLELSLESTAESLGSVEGRLRQVTATSPGQHRSATRGGRHANLIGWTHGLLGCHHAARAHHAAALALPRELDNSHLKGTTSEGLGVPRIPILIIGMAHGCVLPAVVFERANI